MRPAEIAAAKRNLRAMGWTWSARVRSWVWAHGDVVLTAGSLREALRIHRQVVADAKPLPRKL